MHTDKYYSFSKAERHSEFSVIALMHAGGKGQIYEKYQRKAESQLCQFSLYLVTEKTKLNVDIIIKEINHWS